MSDRADKSLTWPNTGALMRLSSGAGRLSAMS
jgi:hypothetical protein